jgi:hypothetical protein
MEDPSGRPVNTPELSHKFLHRVAKQRRWPKPLRTVKSTFWLPGIRLPGLLHLQSRQFTIPFEETPVSTPCVAPIIPATATADAPVYSFVTRLGNRGHQPGVFTLTCERIALSQFETIYQFGTY